MAAMGKIMIVLDDLLEEKLRLYIANKYPTEPYGKLKSVIEEALREFLSKRERSR